MTSVDIDPAVKSALNHLHSTNISSATDIRLILDSLIKKQHGSNKMLVNRLSKKQLDDEENVPGVAPLLETMEIIDSPHPAVEALEENDNDILQINEIEPEETEDIEMNDDFNDLNCIICGSIMYSATNRLMECTECHSLYHQQCHSPVIEDDLYEGTWICSNCKDKAKPDMPNITEPSEPFPNKSSASSSPPSSTSSSPYHKSTEVPPPKPTSSKSSSSSSSLKEDTKVRSKSSSRSEKVSSSRRKKHKSGSSSSKSSSSKDHDKKSKKSSK